jgi:hypothetical protein
LGVLVAKLERRGNLQVIYWILDHLLSPGLAVGFLAWILRHHLSAYLGEKGKMKAQIEDIQRLVRLTEEARQEFVERTAFLAEKGKHAATKEDIEHITHQIESVRTEYLTMLELLKLELSKKGTIHRLRMEKEFETLSQAWYTLAELRIATDQLFPSGLQTRLEGAEQLAHITEIIQAFNSAYNDYLNAIYKNKPFFPRDLYTVLNSILGQAKQVEIRFRYGLDVETGRISPQAFEKGREVLTPFLELVESASVQIDERLNI